MPIGEPRPVLYVAGEDPVAYWHARSVEAICRGLGIDRRNLAQPVELFDAALGRSTGSPGPSPSGRPTSAR